MNVPPTRELATQLFANNRAQPAVVEFFSMGEKTGEFLVFLLSSSQREDPDVFRIKVPIIALNTLTAQLLESTLVLGSRTRQYESQNILPSDEQTVLSLEYFELLPKLLGDLFVTPWFHALERNHPTELIIAPHAVLSYLPLHIANGGGEKLIERYPLTYLPSLAFLPYLRPDNLEKKSSASQALLIGCGSDLTGVEPELSFIQSTLEESGVACSIFFQENATTDKVLKSAHGFEFLHLACHAVLADGKNQFERSGFELYDRRLTAAEIMANLDLRKNLLVFLSACNSGKPPLDAHDDELMTIIRSFFYAGAKSVIASLWALQDDAALIFAKNFYASWTADQKSIAEAYREAMLATKDAYPNVFSWAPFILFGPLCARMR
jgi:CHAT domain-containing protein